MTKAKNPLGLAPFDAADYLTDDAAIAEFLNAALEDGNPDVFLQAVRTAARVQAVPAKTSAQRTAAVLN